MKDAALTLKPSLNIALRPSLLVAAIYAGLLLLVSLTHGYSALDYVHLGTVWSQHNAAGSWGYDGQFYYQLARDPLKAAAFMDDASYRYQRIFYPLVVSLLSLHFVTLVPYILLLVNMLAIVLSVEICAFLLTRHGLSPWYSLAVGLYFGQAAALTFDTAEPFALFLVCLALWQLAEERIRCAALCMGLAALTRDTSVVFAAGYVGSFLLCRAWRSAGYFLLLGVLPLLVWLILLRLIFGKTGLTFTPPFEHTPFAGLFYYVQTPRKFWLLVGLLLVPTLGSCLVAGVELVRQCWRRTEAMGLLGIWLVNLWTIVFLSHASYVDLISCGRISSCLVLIGLLYGLKTRNKLILWGVQYYALTFPVFLIGIFVASSSFLL